MNSLKTIPLFPSGQTHSYHVNARNWIREHRGIYRLADFPAAERPDLMLWYLWSQNRREISEGIYSHETALSLHELSDIMPSKLHMTVPKNFRRNSTIPQILILHRADVDKSDVQEVYGVRVTRPLRTIIDLLRTKQVDESQLKLAVNEALRRGLIGTREIEHTSPECGGRSSPRSGLTRTSYSHKYIRQIHSSCAPR